MLLDALKAEQVRIVPDVSVSGAHQTGLMDSLLGLMLRDQLKGDTLLD